MLPGSRAVLFVNFRGFSDSWRDIAVLSLENQEIRVIAEGTFPRYTDGSLIWSHLGNLRTAPFDPVRLEITGGAKKLLQGAWFSLGGGYVAFDVSASGSLVYIPGEKLLQPAELVWVDRDGRVTSAVEGKGNFRSAAVSPEGERLAVTRCSSLEDCDLWIYQVDEAHWIQLTSGRRVDVPVWSSPPIWSPDGQVLVFTSFESGHPKVWRVRADGSAPPEPLTSGGDAWDIAGGISALDGAVIFMRWMDDAQWDLLMLAAGNDAAPRPFLATASFERWPSCSPDGRWVAYESRETGRLGIHVRPYPGPGPRVTISTARAFRPFWSRDGRELFYQGDKEVWVAPVSTADGFRVGRPTPLFKADFMVNAWAQSIDVAPDGRFLMVRHSPEAQQQFHRVIYIPKWADELRSAVADSE